MLVGAGRYPKDSSLNALFAAIQRVDRYSDEQERQIMIPRLVADCFYNVVCTGSRSGGQSLSSNQVTGSVMTRICLSPELQVWNVSEYLKASHVMESFHLVTENPSRISD